MLKNKNTFSNAMSTIDTIIFDFGGVLSDEGPRERIWNLGPRVREQENAAWQKYKVGACSRDAYAVETLRGTRLASSAHDFNTMLSMMHECSGPGPAYPLVKQLVGRYQLAILSNHIIDWIIPAMKQLELLEQFHPVLVSESCKLAKPDPAFYRLALTKTERKPEQCVFIDNTLKNVEVANKLGIHGLHLTTREALEKDFDRLGINYQ